MNMDIKIDKRLVEIKPGSFIFEFPNSLSSDICKDMVLRFENSKDEHYQGRVGKDFDKDESLKVSTDMVVSGKKPWKDVDEALFTSLSKALATMKREYAYFTGPFKDVGYAIQRTSPGEYFHWHIDADNPNFSDRQLVAIWYLNDVEGPGGETEFLQQNVKVKPELGKLILFPPFWTHEHRGVKLQSGIKYIATTWIVFKQ